MKKNKHNTNTVSLYSDGFCDDVQLNREHYDEFMEVFGESANFDETKAADLLYFAEEMFHGSSFGTTKQRLRLKIADIADVVPHDELIEIKHYELKKLLNASKENYLAIFNNMLQTDNSMEDKKKLIQTVD